MKPVWAYITCAFLLTLPSTGFAVETTSQMTLQEAVSLGLQKSPDLGQALQDSLAAKQVELQARGLNLPSVTLSGETGPEYQKYLGISSQEENMWRSRGTLSLTQLLFDGWGTRSQIEGQKARAESAAFRAGEVAEFSGLEAVQAFLDVLRQRELLQIARSNADEHLRILDIIEHGARGGTRTEGDVAQIRARLAQARATVASSEESLRQAETLFSQKVGDMPGDLAPPSVPQNKLPAGVDEAVEVALLHNPALIVTQSDIKATEMDEAGAKASMYPRVDIEANGSVGDNISGVPGNNQGATILAVARWNLYHGGADMARRSEALYRTASAKERRKQVLLQVEKDTRDTWNGMVSAGDRARDYAEQADANKKVVSVYLDQFTLSRRTLLDVLNAQNELLISHSNNVNAAYAEKFAVYRILALEGQLLKTLGAEKVREAKLAH